MHFWLFASYFSSRPEKPNTDLRIVYALNNHGSHVYLTATETTRLALLVLVSAIGFLTVLAMGLKVAIYPPPGTPQWSTIRGRGSLVNFTPRNVIIFYCSIVVYLLVIWLAGPSIADFIVSHGIILHF
jgi:hypothetical protein